MATGNTTVGHNHFLFNTFTLLPRGGDSESEAGLGLAAVVGKVVVVAEDQVTDGD